MQGEQGACHKKKKKKKNPPHYMLNVLLYSKLPSSFQNRFLSLSLCQSTCETALVEKRVDEDERAGASAASVAETVLGVILCLLAVAAVALGVKYYK